MLRKRVGTRATSAQQLTFKHQHIYWALNQYANAMCRRSCMGRARGVIYPLGNDGSGQRVSIEIEGLDDIWPVPSPEFNTAQHASFVNAYIHQRLGNKTLEDMQTSLFGYNRHMKTFTDERGSRTARPILVCSDRPIYAATQRLLEPIIAQACIRDQQFAEECEAVLTPVRQTAILLEDLQCAAARNFAALSESWLGRQTDHHERLAKSNWVEYVYDIFDVYRSYLAERVSKGWDDNTLEATNAAASALIFMLRGAVDRTSLWHELTLTDLQYDRPRDFWTNVFLAFRSIVEQDGLSREHRSELRAIRERAKELATFNRPTSGIIHALRDIIHA